MQILDRITLLRQVDAEAGFSGTETNARHLYWTPAQMVAHHTSGGCNLMPGDLIGSGTISGPERAELSSLLELTRGGAEPVYLANGERRSWLEDGDEVTFTARCEREGYVGIGFGRCAGRIFSEGEEKLDSVSP